MKFWLCLIAVLAAPTFSGCYDTLSSERPLITEANQIQDDRVIGRYSFQQRDRHTDEYKDAGPQPEPMVSIHMNGPSYVMTVYQDDGEPLEAVMRLHPLAQADHYIMQVQCENEKVCEKSEDRYASYYLVRVNPEGFYVSFFIYGPPPDESSVDGGLDDNLRNLLNRHGLTVVFVKPNYVLREPDLPRLRAFMEETLMAPGLSREFFFFKKLK